MKDFKEINKSKIAQEKQDKEEKDKTDKKDKKDKKDNDGDDVDSNFGAIEESEEVSSEATNTDNGEFSED